MLWTLCGVQLFGMDHLSVFIVNVVNATVIPG